MRLPDWTQKKWTDELGAAELERAGPAVAGELGSWRIRFRVGRWGIDERGSIKLAFRQVSDWGAPQFEDPGGENYTSLHLESRSGAVLEPRFEWRGYIRHWRQALTVDVLDGALWEGDVITIHLGDTASGSPGMRAQTFNESAFEFKFFVDVFGAGHYQPIPESPSLRVRGGEPVRLVATAISEAAVGDGGWLIVKAEDRHGNPAEGYWGRVRLEAEGAPVEAPPELIFDGKGIAVRRTDTLSFRSAGTARIRVRDEENGFVALSNPIVIREEIAGPRLRWGDFHGGQTAPTLGVGSFDEFYAFARDVGALEFTTHQGNCFEVTLKDMEALKERTRAYHEPGRFVPFLGYEWSGTTPMGGDHALFFFDEDVALHRCSHWLQTDLSDAENDRDHITKVYDTFRGTRTISYPHIGGRPSDLTFHDPELEPVIEIHSKHGTFEWFLEESIERGYRVGFAAGSDDHYGHPGAVYPGPHIGHFATGNGLTALYTGELTREGIWEALKVRRCYATNGARILPQISGERPLDGRRDRKRRASPHRGRGCGNGVHRARRDFPGDGVHPLGGGLREDRGEPPPGAVRRSAGSGTGPGHPLGWESEGRRRAYPGGRDGGVHREPRPDRWRSGNRAGVGNLHGGGRQGIYPRTRPGRGRNRNQNRSR
ncbi:MAG: hypothetical protein VCE91_20795 [Nitrospinota bacterium]